MTDPIDVPNIPYLTGPVLKVNRWTVCPGCGWNVEALEGDVFEQEVCPHCGYGYADECKVDPDWPDPIDPTGKRPDQWARRKGHLVFLRCGNGQALDPDHIPFAFSDAGSRRRWPNPTLRPDYRISEAAYDAAIASGPWAKNPQPVRVPVKMM